ncbi:DUF2079 domain-containing protein [Prochlorococcus sp. MIT 1300]|uniref:DUF2079 domain-containing protein n=1 Tax=Prochlorococcus sp. MIT 1300 TaxID=3096218 RepID=UPI002A755298|nr:DUF2079 domain-containing protein [Prochlorococcus sp. MIT 1300]
MSQIRLPLWRLDRQVGLAAGAFFLGCCVLQFWRMQSLTASMDQGIFYQSLWNGLNGHPFESTLSSQLSTNVVHSGEYPEVGYHRLGQHYTPILVLWIPIVGLLGKWALPLIQVTLMAGAGLLLFELAKLKLHIELARMIVFAFYGANAVIGPCLGNFTDLCQLPFLVFGLLLAIEKKKDFLAVLLSIAIPLIREDTGIVLMGVGLWLYYRDRYRWKFALWITLYGAIWVLIVTNIIMPIYSEDNAKRFMIENFGQYVSGQDKASSLEVIGFALKQPLVVLKEFVNPPGKTLRYLAGQGLPLLFVPFLSLDAWLLMGLPLAGLLLAQGNPLAINWRYTYLVVPGLFAGSIYWWKDRSYLFYKKNIRRIWSGFIALSFIFMLTSNPNRTLSWMVPQSINPWVYRAPVAQWKHGNTARKIMSSIPVNASVSASSSLVPHLSAREVLIRFPYHINYRDRYGSDRDVEWILVDVDEHQRYAHVFKTEWRDLQEIILKLRDLKGKYSPQTVEDGLVLYKLNGPSDPNVDKSLELLLENISAISLQPSS